MLNACFSGGGVRIYVSCLYVLYALPLHTKSTRMPIARCDMTAFYVYRRVVVYVRCHHCQSSMHEH